MAYRTFTPSPEDEMSTGLTRAEEMMIEAVNSIALEHSKSAQRASEARCRIVDVLRSAASQLEALDKPEEAT